MPLPAKIQELINRGVITEDPPKKINQYQLAKLNTAAVQELIEKRIISIKFAANLHRMIVWALSHEEIKDHLIEKKLSIKNVRDIISNVLFHTGGYIEGLFDYDFESSDTDSDTEAQARDCQSTAETKDRTYDILLNSFQRNPPLTHAEFRLSFCPDSIFYMGYAPPESLDTESSTAANRL